MVTSKRKSYSKITEVMEIPNLLSVQLDSFRNFLQADVMPAQRKDEGLQRVFQEVFPISDTRDNYGLEFVGYDLGEPKYTIEECQERDVTYAAPLKATLRLIVKEAVEGRKEIKDIIEQEVYLGEIPLITNKGTFIINGAERVVVSQLHRSPGVFFDHDRGKTHSSGKLLFSARVIPYRGSWLDFEFDPKDNVFVRIDRRRKLPATILLRALGYETEEILEMFEREAEQVRETLARYDQVPQESAAYVKDIGSSREAFFWMLTLECGIKTTQALLEWLESVIQRIRNKQHSSD